MAFTVQAFGSNGSGQLALGHTMDVSHPENCLFVDGKPNSRPVRVAAGGNHTLLLYEDGAVYATGNNDNGRCGISPSYDKLTAFVRVNFLSEAGKHVDTFRFVAATWEASIFVTADEEVFTVGTGNFGELGQGPDVIEARKPQLIPSFIPPETQITDVAASMRHCVAVASDGKVYGWGAGRKGQLGIPLEKAVWLPRRICVPHNSLNSLAVSRVVCCRDQTAVLVSSGEYSPLIIFGMEPMSKIVTEQIHDVGAWKDIVASWSGLYVLDKHNELKGYGKHWIPSNPPVGLCPRAIAAGSEHLVAETPEGKILAIGWGEHGNCGELVNATGTVHHNWNEISFGSVLGAGCATSWMLKG